MFEGMPFRKSALIKIRVSSELVLSPLKSISFPVSIFLFFLLQNEQVSICVYLYIFLYRSEYTEWENIYIFCILINTEQV